MALSTTHSWFASLRPKLACLHSYHVHAGAASFTKSSTRHVHATVKHRSLLHDVGRRDICIKERHARRLAEARLMFKKMEAREESVEVLVMIDSLQRLGLDHHFEEDVAMVLKRHYTKMKKDSRGVADINNTTRYNDKLFDTSLRFRLLRQRGHRVASDVFQTFINKEGRLGSKLGGNIMGLMELYEASFYDTKGETDLREAAEFCEAHLLDSSTHDQAKIIANYTLRHPFHRTLPKFNLKHYLNIFQSSRKDYNDTLVDLAKLDFNVDQSMHREEVIMVSKWWAELGLAQELNFARNQPMMWYLWPFAMLVGSKFSKERVELAKPITFVYLIDDIFDVRGSLDDLIAFTETVNRWDTSSTKQLPDYMRKCFMALDELTHEIGYKVIKRHGWNPIPSLQQSWAKLFNAFLVEAKWLRSGEYPRASDYLKNGIVSSGSQVVLVHLFFLLGHGLTQSNVELVNSDDPPVISSVATILRLYDDLSAMDEEHNGYDGSYGECYLKEHPDSSIDQAREHVKEMIEDTWKQLNHECLSPTPFPPAFTRAAHNSAKMVHLMYGFKDKDDNRLFASLEDHIKSMLFESIE